MMQTAGSFLEKSLIDSVEEHVPVNEGVNFEKYLYLLHTQNLPLATSIAYIGIKNHHISFENFSTETLSFDIW